MERKNNQGYYGGNGKGGNAYRQGGNKGYQGYQGYQGGSDNYYEETGFNQQRGGGNTYYQGKK
jgi:hypothetical protein